MKTFFSTIALIALTSACKKESNSPPLFSQPSVSSIVSATGNPYFVYNDSTAVKGKAVSRLNYNDRGIIFIFYGDKNALGKITKVTAVTMQNKNNPDTILNFAFDDSMRVKSFYFTVSGKPDTKVVRVTYQDSLQILTGYEVDWKTGAASYKEQIAINNFSATNHTIFDLATSNIPVKLAKNAAVGFLGGLLLADAGSAFVLVVGTTLAPPVATALGLGLIHYALDNVKQMKFEMIKVLENALDAFLPPSAQAKKTDRSQSLLSSPTRQLKKIVGAEFFYCPCSWFWPVRNYIGTSSMWGLDYNKMYHLKEYTTTVLGCGDLPVEAGSGISFLLKNGVGVSLTFTEYLNIYCSERGSFSYSKDFLCPL